ncbi:hypothetical protein AB0H76_29280 [Nocardia sp. NPDC050712]|uniref:hypothetical protein n=1 Tax=Nocardia sp. NPDC050712 TaxID=3155518 RepID=UPI0033F26183
MPQQQPVSQSDSPEQSYRPIEAFYVCDSKTALRLSRAAALLAWRLPLRWGILLVLPVFLLTRGTIQLLAEGTGTEPRAMLGTCSLVLALEVFAVCIGTAVRMVHPGANIKAYSYSGARMSARYTPEAMELSLVTQPLTHSYDDIRKIIATDDVVYVHAAGTNGYVLPRELVPDEALALLQRPRYVSVATPVLHH